jgi:monofunctional biosynthetic peptidoglycan transglycosylase
MAQLGTISAGSLFDFRDPTAAAAWRTLDDDVMGGISASRVDATDGALVFSGVLRLDHGGGFASCRAPLPRRLPPVTTAIVIRWRGDGRGYELRLRCDESPRAIAWRAPLVAPAGAWSTSTLALSGFEAVFRGRALEAPLPPPDAWTGIGIMLADRRAGAFAMAVAAIGWVGAGSGRLSPNSPAM